MSTPEPDHPRARGRDVNINLFTNPIPGSPPRTGTRLTADAHLRVTARITPARGDETLASKLLISCKTSSRLFGYHEIKPLCWLKPKHAAAIGALPPNSGTHHLNELCWIVDPKMPLYDGFGQGLARHRTITLWPHEPAQSELNKTTSFDGRA